MKFLVYIFTSFIAFNCFGQNGNNQIEFRVLCGAGAQTSEEIGSFKSSSSLADTVVIKKMLLKGTDVEQILSAIILKYYYSKGLVKLTGQDETQLNKLSKSKKRFSLCYTCTYYEEGTLKELFHKPKKFIAYNLITEFLIDSL